MDEDDFFEGQAEARRIYQAIRAAVEALGDAEVRVSKSQIGFYRKRPFASVWRPGQYLGKGPPLVLTIYLRRRDRSARWKEVVEPKPGRFTHHLELHSAEEVDAEVRGRLAEAWTEAGSGR